MPSICRRQRLLSPDGTSLLGVGANGCRLLPPSPEALMYMVLVRGVTGSDAALADGSFVHAIWMGHRSSDWRRGRDADGSDVDGSSFKAAAGRRRRRRAGRRAFPRGRGRYGNALLRARSRRLVDREEALTTAI